MEEIVVEMNTYTKWWDSWFVVADLTIPLFLDDYDYFTFSPVYLLTDGDVEKKKYVGEVEDCVLHAAGGIFVIIVEDVGDGSNYIVYHNSNYSNKEIH